MRQNTIIATKITLVYLILGATWITLSDYYVVWVGAETDTLFSLHTLKGWLFVLVTSAILYSIIGSMTARLQVQHDDLVDLTRTYGVLSGINSLILRERDRQVLLNEACRLAADKGGFRLTWIGLVGNGFIQPAAFAGPAAAYVNTRHFLLDEAMPEGQTPEAKTVRLHEAFVCNRLAQAHDLAANQAAFIQHDLQSAACFPIHVQQRLIGIIAFYADAADAFDPAEIRLLEELAADIGMGLEHIEKDSRLNYLAQHDELTGLARHSLLQERISAAIENRKQLNRQLAVVSIGVKSFPLIVDTLGRDIGDRLLIEVAQILSSQVRAGDTVARTGTHEFSVLLTNMADIDDTGTVVHKLLQPFPHTLTAEDGSNAVIHIVAGVARYPMDGDLAHELIRHAELAMHSALTDTGLTAYYSPALDEQAQWQQRIEQGLHQALEREEFRLVYQPIVDTRSGLPIGFESLLRWDSAALGQVSPADFIPIAESSGQIVAIGSWVLEQACLQLRELNRDRPQALTLSVNVSARQVLHPHFLEDIEALLDRHGLRSRAELLAIEITETDLLHDLEHAIDVLSRIKQLGIRIYLDDFGTGYSSLSYLNRLPVDLVKIDRSFVSAIASDIASGSLVKGIVAMARGLDLRILAEGVETAEQFERLRQLECHYVQGYLFSRPMDAADVDAYLRKPQQLHGA